MSATRLAKTAIKIPMRIERGPTDILKALASTVKYIPKEPEHSLVDDPFLLPRRPNDRTNFILSKLSGKRAARFILNKHPELFFRDQAEPKIEAFSTPEKFESDMDFTEEDLLWCIENKDPENALVAYHAMKEKDVEIGNETMLSFFEMICFTNEERVLDSTENDISRFFRDPDKQLVDQTWKTTGTASKIFNQIKEDIDPSRVYSAMIAGLCKFNEHAAAKQVFDDFVNSHSDKGLYISAYDGLLRSVVKLESGAESAHKAVDEIVGHMEANLVAPDLRIFNSILQVYRSFNTDDATCKRSFQLINDMRSLGVEPSLATYSVLCSLVIKNRGGKSYGSLVRDIICVIVSSSEKHIALREERDTDFLVNCMNTVSNYMHDLKLANRLHRIYLMNPSLFQHQHKRWQYLSDYFRLIITTDNLENILKLYDEYVPLTFKPRAETYDALAEALDLYQADKATVKRIGEDIIEFNLYNKMTNDKVFRNDPDYVEKIIAKEEEEERRRQFKRR